MRFDDGVVLRTTFFFAVQKAAALHQSQVIGHHRARYFTRIRELSDGKTSVEQHVHNLKTVRVRKNFQAFGSMRVFLGGKLFCRNIEICHIDVSLSEERSVWASNF